jgi:hypothetical protein
MIAKPSPNDSLETKLLMAESEKRADREPHFVRTVRSLQSGLESTNREIRSKSADFRRNGRPESSAV